jgi:hypothetical protein
MYTITIHLLAGIVNINIKYYDDESDNITAIEVTPARHLC